MTSVIRAISQTPTTVSTAVLSGGNGSNSGLQGAIATIDPRYGNTFIIDTTRLTNSGPLQYRVHILIKSAYTGAVAPGKVIHLLFKLGQPPYSPPATSSISCFFDTTLGANIPPVSTSGYNAPCVTISLIADGTQFQLLTQGIDWGYED